MDRTTYEDRQQERIAELRQGILVLTGLYRSAEEDVDFWHSKTESLTREMVRLNGVLDGLCPFCGGTRDSASHLVGCPDLGRALAEVERLRAAACVCEPSDYARRGCPVHSQQEDGVTPGSPV